MTHFEPPDDELRALLDDAVSNVEPSQGLDAIRGRTASSARRPWAWASGGAVVATAATVAAFLVLGTDPVHTGGGGPGYAAPASPAPSRTPSPAGTPTPSRSSSPPTRPPSPTATTTSAGADTGAGQGAGSSLVPVYYMGTTGHGPRLFREFHPGTTGVGTLLDALRQAVSESPMDPDYRSPWPPGTRVAGATYAGDVVTVDLTSDSDLRDRPAVMSAAEAAMAVEQVVYTAQAALQQGRPPVRFLVDGQPTGRLLGRPVAAPQSQGSAGDVLAQVWIIDPAEGARVHSGFEVSGVANVFEATVLWELEQHGRVVRRGYTTATRCCTMAPYSFTVDAPPGRYTVVVHDGDPSGGEGYPPWRDTKRLTVIR